MTLPKIEEWIQEVETRPGSAVTILKLIAARLRELTERNEALLAENIALQDGSMVKDYQRRIAHLEFQLDLLKRRFGMDPQALEALTAAPAPRTEFLLVYNARGRILRIEPQAGSTLLGRLEGDLSAGGEPPRLLPAREGEELLLLFSTGRIGTCALESIPLLALGENWTWEQGALPAEPHAGERLSCLLPLAELPLVDYFLQTSRRGCLKKTMTTIADTVLTNHFLGKGAIEKTDQPFGLCLCCKGERFAMVSHEGRLFGLEVDDLSYSVEERIKLDGTDHIVGSFTYQKDDLLFCLTQTGKVISKSSGWVEPVKSSLSRGQALIPPGRLEQGIRFIGAAPVKPSDQVAVLEENGRLSLHPQASLVSAGSLETEAPLISFGILPGKDEKEQP